MMVVPHMMRATYRYFDEEAARPAALLEGHICQAALMMSLRPIFDMGISHSACRAGTRRSRKSSVYTHVPDGMSWR
jgi:hypothetical protein